MDWADEKAEEWLDSGGGASVWDREPEPYHYESLAALLREVKEQGSQEAAPFTVCRQCHDRDGLLAEVRRVVEDCQSYSANHPDQSFMAGHRYACLEILSRLEKL